MEWMLSEPRDLKRIEDAKTPEQKEAEEDMRI